MSKKTKSNSTKETGLEFTVVNPHAAGIDIAAKMHAVAVPPGRDIDQVRMFGAFTSDLQEIANWLQKCGVTTVAMESTGVYWKPLFTVLVEHGFEVYLVNARQVKSITGRKTDMDDARWIQKLHSCGLLNTSFLPDNETESLRTLVRYRRTLMQDSTRYVLRMEKSLELMNIKIHSTITDLMGKTGKAIVEAIIGGERDAVNFMQYVDPRIKASRSDLIQSLQGNWRAEHLFTLRHCYELYHYLQQKIAACDQEIELLLQHMSALQQYGEIEAIPLSTKRKTKNQPAFNVKGYLHKVHGIDVTAIYGMSEVTSLEVLSETGTDLNKWESEKHFVSWLNLCPNNKITGGKLISSKILKKKSNPAAQAFRAAANSLKTSENWLGDYFRRKKSKGGHKYAIVATARKLAVIYYLMVKNKQEFNPIDLNEYRSKYKESRINYLEKQLAKLKAVA
ncbi:MAG: IS110 family transposase [Bacteroidota bacterium]